jgi:hypothetical protein
MDHFVRKRGNNQFRPAGKEVAVFQVSHGKNLSFQGGSGAAADARIGRKADPGQTGSREGLPVLRSFRREGRGKDCSAEQNQNNDADVLHVFFLHEI